MHNWDDIYDAEGCGEDLVKIYHHSLRPSCAGMGYPSDEKKEKDLFSYTLLRFSQTDETSAL